MTNLRQPLFRLGDRKFQVLRGDAVGHLDGLGEVTHQDGSRLRTPQCGRCPLPVPGRAQSALKSRIDGVRQLRGVGDEDAAGIGIVLRLGEQVGGHVLGVGPGVGQDGDLGGSCLGIDADRRIHVATRAKRIETVHLQTGLLPFEGRSLTHVPASKQMHPDGDRLAEHFEDFLKAEAQTVR
mgnify:CR=1 FL=1